MRHALATFAVLTLIAFVGAAFEQEVDFSTRTTDWASAAFQSAAVLGVLSMVLLQSAKQSLRERFHLRTLRRWLLEGEGNFKEGTFPDNFNESEAFDRLLHLIAPSYARDVLALPVEQLSAQIASAAEIALANPGHIQELALLAGPAGMRFAEHLEYLLRKGSPSLGGETSGERSAELIQVRNELSHEIQRRIDGWQIHTARRWRTTLRFGAVVVSALLATAGVILSGSLIKQPFTSFSFIMTVGLLGGLLASVARDIVAVIEKHRI